MRTRLKLAAPGAIAAAALAAALGCSGGGGSGSLTVQVTAVDGDGHPLAAALVVASAHGQVLGTALTGANGKATIALESGGELTVYDVGFDPTIELSATMTGVTASSVLIPIDTLDQNFQTVDLQTSTSGSIGTGRSGRVWAAGYSRPITVGVPAFFTFYGALEGTDENISYVVAVTDTARGVTTAQGWALDQLTVTTSLQVAVHGTAAMVAASGQATFQGIPAGAVLADVSAARKGRPIGPVLAANATAPASGPLVINQALPDAPLYADALRADALFLLPGGSSYQVSAMSGSFGAGITVNLAGGPMGVPTGVAVAGSGGTPQLLLTDPGAQGTDTFGSIVWSDASGTHTWWIYSPAPTGASTRALGATAIPAIPALTRFRLTGTPSFSGSLAGYQRASDVPDFQANPDPLKGAAKRGPWQREVVSFTLP